MVTGFTLLAQDRDIQHIVDRNPFDPDRGRVEEEEGAETTPPEEDTIPEEMPVLDGTMVIGNMRVAIMSAQKDGKTVSIRVEMTGKGSDYLLYLREKSHPPKKNKSNRPSRRPRTQNDEVAKLLEGQLNKEDEEDEIERLVINGEPNGKIGPYLVTKITREAVWLNGGGEPIKLEMFREGVEKSRGGTKTAPPKAKPKPQTRPSAKPGDPKAKPGIKPASKNSNKNNKKNFNKRKQPPKPRGSSRAQDLKERF